MEEPLLTIRQVAAKTDLREATLRAWERRFGFPRPARAAGGHRRYAAGQVDQLLQVKRSREEGLSLEAAIRRVSEASPPAAATVYAAVAESAGVRPLSIRKRELSAVVRALEDEMLASGARPLVIAAFQQERFYRASERRYLELARVSEMVVVRADFDAVHEADGTLEVPLDRSEPASREWCLVCYAPVFTIALAALEVIDHKASADDERLFEMVWAAGPQVVREAARTAVSLAAEHAPEVAARAAPLLEGEPPPEGHEHRRLAGMANRVLEYLVRPDRVPV